MRPEEIKNYYVETQADREIIDAIKGRNPVILVGSRGIGKSILLKVAEQEMITNLSAEGVLPVYVSFIKNSLLNSTDPEQFTHWMLARLCSQLIRALRKTGLISASRSTLSILSGGPTSSIMNRTRIEDIKQAYEDSWKTPNQPIDITGLPSVDDVKEAIEELCDEIGIRRISFLIDEAAHILWPEQQRAFFTLFRDLRSPYISCNAAVYQGVTAYGDSFQPTHDANMRVLERDILSGTYVKHMREIVEKQADSKTVKEISQQGERFAVLAYAATGNPRLLLTTVKNMPKIGGTEINQAIRTYYRNDIWSEHSSLAERYAGYKNLVDWGRKFIEEEVLPELQKKNIQYMADDKSTSCFFWISREAPQPVKEALRLLSYVGIVSEHATGIKATRGLIGTRYAVNLGCLLALEAVPTDTGFRIATSLTPKRMSEYGANHPAFAPIANEIVDNSAINPALGPQLSKQITVLDITPWLSQGLQEIGINTIGDILSTSESDIRQIPYVGEIRARKTRNTAMAAVFEYLSS